MMLVTLPAVTALNWVVSIVAVILLAIGCQPARAQELLLNRSFENITGLSPAPANGNNFYLTVPNWSVTGTQALPANLIKPFAGYANNPTVTPTGGGAYYLDVNSSAGTVRQSVTLVQGGIVDFSTWFSVRDFQQALSGNIINIRNSSNVVVASTSVSFLASDPIGLWKQASAVNIPLAAGTYVFEIIMPDFANTDLASFVYRPPLVITKTSAAYSDPVNGIMLPKLIPGAIAEYLINVVNPATHAITADSIAIVDQTPANVEFAIGSFGPGPAAFAQGMPSSTLSYTYSSLSSTSDDFDVSYDGGLTWTSSPGATAIADGFDPAVTHIRLRPKGTMAAGSSFSFRIRYRVK